MSDYYRESEFKSDDQSLGPPDGNKRRQQVQQPRQLLSCTKCRERKVKCDRTKPCSACCARGQPKECHFVAEAGDYAPIQQSYELRKLRAENMRLKEQLRASQIPIDEDESDIAPSPGSYMGERTNAVQKRRGTKQKRFQGSEWQDSIYFGSPGLANVVEDFANVNINTTSASLAHLLPKGSDMFTPETPTPYPFPTLFAANAEECIPKLLGCLPQGEELDKRLSAFEKRVSVCSFPYVPFETTKSEVDRFLKDAKKNAQMCPDMLALLFAAIALGGQHCVWDRSGDRWEAGAMLKELQKGDIYIAAAMQALRLASFMHKPSLLGIQALIMIGPYLTNSGRFLDAWTLFGTTIRLAHSIGLHRHPKHLNPVPPTQRECSTRQTIWWWMLHMDEQYSMTLGRPLGISGIGDCPPPLELTTDRQMLRFGDFVNHFTVLARRALSSDVLNTARIDELTDEFRSLVETMPEALQFDESWLAEGKELPEWPLNAMAAVYYCKTHTYIVLLNRQRLDKSNIQPYNLLSKASTPTFRAINRMTASSQASPIAADLPLRGRDLVIDSATHILDVFVFFYERVPAALVSWTMAQQAFNACMLLLLDAIELGEVTSSVANVEKAYFIFLELQGVHKLASMAIERISWGLQELKAVTQRPPRPERSQDNEMQGVQSEATHASRSMCGDAVMNATGMLLLEDSGLQGFVPEAFTPITWNFEGNEPTLGFHAKQEMFGDTTLSGSPIRSPLPGENLDDFRPAGVMQGLPRSTTMRSAPTRYATQAMDDPPPPGVTVPTSRAPPQQQIKNRPNSIKGLNHPPHFRHAQLREDHQKPWNHLSVAAGPNTAPILDTGRFQRPGQGLDAQMRHNSCPSIPQVAAAPPASRAPHRINTRFTAENAQPRARLPVISDQASFGEFSHSTTQSMGSQLPWAPAGSSNVMHGLLLDGPQTAASYPMQLSHATTTSGISADDWRRWLESSGPG